MQGTERRTSASLSPTWLCKSTLESLVCISRKSTTKTFTSGCSCHSLFNLLITKMSAQHIGTVPYQSILYSHTFSVCFPWLLGPDRKFVRCEVFVVFVLFFSFWFCTPSPRSLLYWCVDSRSHRVPVHVIFSGRLFCARSILCFVLSK